MAVQGGGVGQKWSEKHVRNMWTAPYMVFLFCTMQSIQQWEFLGFIDTVTFLYSTLTDVNCFFPLTNSCSIFLSLLLVIITDNLLTFHPRAE